MARVVAELIQGLEPDPWRDTIPFASDFKPWHERILGAESVEEVARDLNEWLQKYQPCLFGRLAAKASAITYCVLRDNDLDQSDETIMTKYPRSSAGLEPRGFLRALKRLRCDRRF